MSPPLLSFCWKFRTNKKKLQDFSISTKNKKQSTVPCLITIPSIPVDHFGVDKKKNGDHFGVAIISGSIWGSFQGWGSFRGRDHFGSCTVRSRSLTRADENGSDDIDISLGYRRRGRVSSSLRSYKTDTPKGNSKCSEYNPKVGPLKDLHTRGHNSYFSSTKRSSHKTTSA